MAFTFPPLPYNIDELYSKLDPVIVNTQINDIAIGYINTINKLIVTTAAAGSATLQQALSIIKKTTSNPELFSSLVHATNHIFFWENVTPNNKTAPSPELQKEIDITFGSLDGLKSKMEEITKNSPNSPMSFTWLVLSNGHLQVKRSIFVCVTPTPSTTPLLSIAGWMGSFDTLWNLINWEQVNDRFARIAR